MKDIADLTNSVGSFPDVTAVDCSGAGATDGTALSESFFNDLFGFLQAIMDEADFIPSGSNDVNDNSQLLNGLKLIMSNHAVSILNGSPVLDTTTKLPEWTFDNDDWRSEINFGEIGFPLDVPNGFSCDCDVTVTVQPGTTRTGTNRMKAEIFEKDSSGSASLISSSVYDDGTAAAQDIEVGLSAVTFNIAKTYFVRVTAGNDGATNNDSVYFVNQEYYV